MASYFSGPNNTKYLAPSKTLTNPSACHESKYFHKIFHSRKILSKSKSWTLIMSSK